MIEYVTSRDFLILMAKMFSIFGGVMTALAYTTLLERRVMAFVQMRPGPNRVGPMGLLQPLADGLKFLLKEQVVPTNANVLLYYAAPIVSLVPALLSFSVIPFGPDLKMTDISVSLLFVFAITSLGVYGIVLGGWASNSKYPLMGAMRASAQMLSYELSLTLSVVGVLMIAHTLSLAELVHSQQGTWFGFIPRWNIFLQPIAFVVYVVSAVAETNRLPFDLAESEQELVAGWHTEYSGMKFAMFFLAEYANMVTVSSLATILFLGGWNGPMFGPWWLQMALPTIWFVSKIFCFIFAYIMVRATVPRIRYDQLMQFGWKILLPLALANILITSLVVGAVMIQILFFFFAALAVGAAINVLAQKHVLYSSLSLIVMLTSVSALFVLLQAEFLAVINVIVYAGAIMVLFVFVIMLLNLPSDPSGEDGTDRLRWLKLFGIPLGLFLLLMIGSTVWNVSNSTEATQMTGTAEAIGRSLFTDYLLPFELTSLLILIALMGAVVFAKKDL